MCFVVDGSLWGSLLFVGEAWSFFSKSLRALVISSFVFPVGELLIGFHCLAFL